MDEIRLLLSPLLRIYQSEAKKKIEFYSSPTRFNQKAIGIVALVSLSVDVFQDLYCFLDSFPELINSVFWLHPTNGNRLGDHMDVIRSMTIADLSSSRQGSKTPSATNVR